MKQDLSDVGLSENLEFIKEKSKLRLKKIFFMLILRCKVIWDVQKEEHKKQRYRNKYKTRSAKYSANYPGSGGLKPCACCSQWVSNYKRKYPHVCH